MTHMARTTGHQGKTPLVVLVVIVLAAAVATSAHAGPAAAGTPGCPAGTSPFEDVLPSSFAFDDVACIYRLGITKGTSPSTYDPGATVTRGQMAAFLARLWRAAGRSCPTGDLPFADIGPSASFRTDIKCIFGLGITKGTSADAYSPDSAVTREQMAAFLARLWRATGSTCPVGPIPFVDVPDTSFAAADITCLRLLGVTGGVGSGLYAPDRGVTRLQMAAFIARLWRATGLTAGLGVIAVRPHLTPPPPLPTTPGSTFMFEGMWSPRGPLIDGYRGVFSTLVRPSTLQPSIFIFEVWIDPMLTDIELFPGSQRPGGSWSQPNYVPADRCPSLIFTGNGGFKMDQSRGGYYAEGRVASPLVDGVASFVSYRDQRVDITQWGRGATIAELPQIRSVRQNLELIVDNGSVVAGLDAHPWWWWGRRVRNSEWVWRSGWGIKPDGALLYIGGPGLSIADLASRFVDAGAARAMQADINPHWITGNLYSVDSNGNCRGEKGLPQPLEAGGFRRSGDRYLSPDASDFIGVFADRSRWTP